MSLLMKLEESLKEMEVSNNVVVLFGLLIEAKKLVTNLENKTKSEIHTESQKIWKSINEVKAFCFVKKGKFFELLKVSDPKFEDFSCALLNINKTVHRGNYLKLHYLQRLIIETEGLMLSSTKYQPCDFHPEEKEYLKILEDGKDIAIETCDNEAEKILGLIFEMHRGTNSDEYDKEEIENLIIDAIEPILLYIESLSGTFRRRLDTSILKKRSALQIIIDEYGKFIFEKPDDVKELNKSIKILDTIIEKWCYVFDSEDGQSNLESAGALDMPKEHTWWSKFLKPAVSTQK